MGHFSRLIFQVQNFYNTIRPKTLPHSQWQLRMEFTLLFPREK